MRRRARFGGGGLVCTGEASSVLAETRVGGSSRFLGERFVFEMSAALGGVGGFLLLVKKSVMERCCDICESVSVNKRLTRSFGAPRRLDSPVNAHATAMLVIRAAWAARGAKVQSWPKEALSRAQPNRPDCSELVEWAKLDAASPGSRRPRRRAVQMRRGVAAAIWFFGPPFGTATTHARGGSQTTRSC